MLEPGVASELAIRSDEVVVEDAQIVEAAAERSDVVPEPSTVEITPLSELDPSSKAVEPELASELAGQADQVTLEAAMSESPVAQREDSESRRSDEGLHDPNPEPDCRPDAPENVVADPPEVCGRTFPAVAPSVADARRFAVQALPDIPADVVQDIRLMVSELASNAIEHAMSGFQLTIYRSRREIRVEVTDYGGGTPAMRATGPGALRARGLQIVNTISTRWGVDQESDSTKTVWFTRELTPTASPTPPG
jgi:anti-sigma regulatory factor (Ser/Thr protein kinase)